jgi:lysophospholipase L1-like esterase
MNSKKYIPINTYEKNMQKIVNVIKKIKSRIMLINLLPAYEPYLFTRHKKEFYEPEGYQGRLLQMNQRIKEIAKRNNLDFLDLHHIFSTIGNIGMQTSSLIKNEANSKTTDGLHPTADGYRVIALAIYDQIRYKHLPSKKIVCFGDSITLGDGIEGGENYPSYLRKLLAG